MNKTILLQRSKSLGNLPQTEIANLPATEESRLNPLAASGYIGVAVPRSWCFPQRSSTTAGIIASRSSDAIFHTSNLFSQKADRLEAEIKVIEKQLKDILILREMYGDPSEYSFTSNELKEKVGTMEKLRKELENMATHDAELLDPRFLARIEYAKETTLFLECVINDNIKKLLCIEVTRIENEVGDALDEIDDNRIYRSEQLTSDELKKRIYQMYTIKSYLKQIGQEFEKIATDDPQLLGRIEIIKREVERCEAEADLSIIQLTDANPISLAQKNHREIDAIEDQIHAFFREIDAIRVDFVRFTRAGLTEVINRIGGLKADLQKMTQELEKIAIEDPQLLEKTNSTKMMAQICGLEIDEKIQLLHYTSVPLFQETRIKIIEREIQDTSRQIIMDGVHDSELLTNDELKERAHLIEKIQAHLYYLRGELKNIATYPLVSEDPQFLEKIHLLKGVLERCDSMAENRIRLRTSTLISRP